MSVNYPYNSIFYRHFQRVGRFSLKECQHFVIHGMKQRCTMHRRWLIRIPVLNGLIGQISGMYSSKALYKTGIARK